MRDSDQGRNASKDASGDETVVNRRTEVAQGPLEAFQRSIKLFFTKDMGLLSVAFFYIGKLKYLPFNAVVHNYVYYQVSSIPF